MSALIKVLVPIAVLAALAACGGGADQGGKAQQDKDDENAVRFVLSDLQAASRDGDADRICNRIFTAKLADSVTSAADSGSCAKEVKEKLFSPNERIVVEDVRVSDPANATATVTEQNGNRSKVSLVKQGGEWRIRSVQPA